MASKRVLTSLVGLPVLAVVVLWSPPLVFFAALLVVALLGQMEFYTLLEHRGRRLQKLLGLLGGALVLRGFYYGDATLVLRVLVLLVVVLLLGRTFSSRAVETAADEVGVTLLGLFYVPFLFGYVLMLRDLDQGRLWVLFLFAAVWAGDTGAYYLGSRFGRRRLHPRVSPRKTWEGAVGGLGCSLAAAALAGALLFPGRSAAAMAGFGGLLGAAGQAGDLAESLIKRCSGSKDSGSLFPGHGGVLDRFDGVLFAAPLLYYVLWLD